MRIVCLFFKGFVKISWVFFMMLIVFEDVYQTCRLYKDVYVICVCLRMFIRMFV